MLRCFAALPLLAAALSSLALGQDSDSIGVARSSAHVPPPRSTPAPACSPDRRTNPKAGVVISEIDFEGTSVGSIEFSTIKSQITGACFDEDTDIIADAVRSAFSDHGFAQAEIENVTLNSTDTLSVPKPVTLRAEITEGPRFHVAAIRFIGNHAFSDTKLRAAFPIKKGELYQRSKIKGGFEAIRKLYAPKGYQDLTLSPDIMFSSTATVDLTMTVSEGPQYHMGELKIYAKKEVSDRMASEWHLRAGAVFNRSYPQAFLDSSHSLPTEFGSQNVVIVRNCPEASIAVLLIVDQTDPGLQTPPERGPLQEIR